MRVYETFWALKGADWRDNKTLSLHYQRNIDRSCKVILMSVGVY